MLRVALGRSYGCNKNVQHLATAVRVQSDQIKKNALLDQAVAKTGVTSPL
jgi:hypothetical protein